MTRGKPSSAHTPSPTGLCGRRQPRGLNRRRARQSRRWAGPGVSGRQLLADRSAHHRQASHRRGRDSDRRNRSSATLNTRRNWPFLRVPPHRCVCADRQSLPRSCELWDKDGIQNSCCHPERIQPAVILSEAKDLPFCVADEIISDMIQTLANSATACLPNGSATKPPGSPWRRNPDDWPGKFRPSRGSTRKIVRLLAAHEQVHILVNNSKARAARNRNSRTRRRQSRSSQLPTSGPPIACGRATPAPSSCATQRPRSPSPTGDSTLGPSYPTGSSTTRFHSARGIFCSA